MRKLVDRIPWRRMVPLILYIVWYLLAFFFIESLERPVWHDVGHAFDALIPFNEYFVIFYYSWFPFMAVYALWLAVEDTDGYDRLQTALMIGMTFFIVFSLIYPNCIHLRPESVPRDNVFSRLLQGIWAVDTSKNVLPSIHVYNSVIIAFIVCRSQGEVIRKPWSKVLVVAWSSLICLSTVFTKQHSVTDVLAGLVMFVVVALLIYKGKLVFRFRRWNREK